MATYAVIKTGGKQYRVQQGDVIDVELLDADKEVVFEEVLLFCKDSEGDKGENIVGAPLVPKCVVRGEVLGKVRGPKVIAYKFKRRKDSHRKVGHRQNYTRVKITEIAG